MAPMAKKAAATAAMAGIVALSVTPSISGAPTAGAPAGGAPATYPRLTAAALAELDASHQVVVNNPDDASSARSDAESARSEAESEAASDAESAASEAASDAESDAESAASDAESAASDGVVGDSPIVEEEPDCFPAAATAELADGRVVAMADLAVGDKVRVAAGDGPAAFSAVFLFTHKLPTPPRSYVRLTTSEGGAALTASAGHYVYAGGRLVAAAAVAVGDTLQVVAPGGGWATATVTGVRRVDAAGLYNPQTLHGDIVVDGVRASTFTTAVEPAVASALLAPLRAVYRSTGRSVGLLGGGGGVLTSLAPRGKAVVC